MQRKTWHSKTSHFMDTVKLHRTLSPALICATFDYVLDMTNHKPNTIKWSYGKGEDPCKVTLLPGGCFLTLKGLKDFLRVKHSNTAKRYLEELKEYFGIEIIISDDMNFGGVLFFWKDWEEVSRPWTVLAPKNVCTGDAPDVQPSNPCPEDLSPPAHFADIPHVQPLNTQYNNISNNNIINSLSHTETEQKLNSSIIGESERGLINLYKDLFGRAAKPQHIENFLVQLQDSSVEAVAEAIRTIAADPILKAATFSINGVFHLENRQADLRKLKSEFLAALVEIAKDWDVSTHVLFEKQISMLYPKLVRRVNRQHDRINFKWTEKDFRAYFAEEISHALEIFESRVGEAESGTLHSTENHQSPSTQAVEIKVDESDLGSKATNHSEDRPAKMLDDATQVSVKTTSEGKDREDPAQAMIPPEARPSSDFLKTACAAAFADPNQKNVSKIEDEREKVRQIISNAKNEKELEDLIARVSSEFEIPEELASRNGLISYFGDEIDAIALRRNEDAKQKFVREQKMRKQLVHLGASVKKLRPIELSLPFPSFEKQKNTSEEFEGRAV